jgi:hypothetical protein
MRSGKSCVDVFCLAIFFLIITIALLSGSGCDLEEFSQGKEGSGSSSSEDRRLSFVLDEIDKPHLEEYRKYGARPPISRRVLTDEDREFNRRHYAVRLWALNKRCEAEASREGD